MAAALDAWQKTEDRDERHFWAELQAEVGLNQMFKDFPGAGPDPEPMHIAAAIIARLDREAAEAHERAVAAAPEQVPELLTWTTPKPLGSSSPRSLGKYLAERLASV